MSRVIDVVAAVIWREGRFLAARRPPGKPLAGFWEFPGGKVEPGEGLEAALARELDEELGLDPLATSLWTRARHDYDHARVRLHFFRVDAFNGLPTPREGHELRWLYPAEARDYPFLEADTEVVRALARQTDKVQKEPKVRISDLVAENKGFISLEFFPPKDPDSWPAFFEVVARLKAIDPLFVSVTYGAGGGTQANTLEIVKGMKRDQGLEVLSHLTCVGADEERIAAYLDALMSESCRNVLALRGDPPRGVDSFVPDNERFRHASDLVAFIKDRHPDMCVGVAAYPGGHPEAKTIRHDYEMLKFKLDQGADFATTQLFFDNRVYWDFAERMAVMGVDKPLIPGILPILSLSSIKRLLSMCAISVPAKLLLSLEEADAKGGTEAVREMGMAHAVAQVRDLLDNGAPGVHLYTLNQAEACLEIVQAVRGL